MSEWILEGEDLQYAYEDGTQALRGLSFAVRRGEKLAIMGPNGSGKSTLFLHLNGVLKPAAGRVLVNGQPVDYSRKGLLELRRRVGIVFQDPDDQLFCADVAGEISFGWKNVLDWLFGGVVGARETFQFQQAAGHVHDLPFFGLAVAHHSLLHLHGRILINGQSRLGNGQQNHTPAMGDPDTGGDVVAPEQLFHGNRVGFQRLEQFCHVVVDHDETGGKLQLRRRGDGSIAEHTGHAPRKFHQSKAYGGKARINT